MSRILPQLLRMQHHRLNHQKKSQMRRKSLDRVWDL